MTKEEILYGKPVFRKYKYMSTVLTGDKIKSTLAGSLKVSARLPVKFPLISVKSS